MLDGLASFFINLINWFISAIATAMAGAINLLPDSPIQSYLEMFEVDGSILQLLNYVFPLQEFIPIAITMIGYYVTAKLVMHIFRIGRFEK